MTRSGTALVHLRVMTLADVPSGMRLKELAGWNQTAADWGRFLGSSPGGCFVAESEGRVCGTVTTIVYESRFAWIGMVLVDPETRGRGIGTRLLEKAIEHLDACGIPAIKLDATPQGRPVYEKLGFVPECEIERWMLCKRAKPELRRSAFPLPNLSELQKFDREVFGADRSSLLASLDRDAPEFTMSIHRGEEIAGYALGRRGSRADHLGPWLARDESSARELLDEFLRRSTRDTIFVDWPKSNPVARLLLRSSGFEFSRPLTRMFRGPNAHPGCPKLLCAILGPEFG